MTHRYNLVQDGEVIDTFSVTVPVLDSLSTGFAGDFGGMLSGNLAGASENERDIIVTATIPHPPSNLPGGPYTEKPSTPGNRPGSFQGPRQPRGPRSQAQWVPPEAEGGPPGSNGYWKVQLPGEQGWNRYNRNGWFITPEQAHPNSSPTRSFFFLGPIGAILCTIFCESPAN